MKNPAKKLISRSIICDLDGTMLDISERCYRIYVHLLTQKGCAILSKNDYWKHKRHATKEKEIIRLTATNVSFKNYIKERSRLMEQSTSLAYDILVAGVRRTLFHLSRHSILYLVTMRKHRNTLMRQLTRLDIKKYFTRIISQRQGIETKTELLQLLAVRPPALVIGDTEEDILAGKILQYTTCAVSNGIRTRALLQLTHPDFIIKNFTHISTVLS